MAHVGSWEWDGPSASVTCSDELYRIFGIPPAEPDLFERALALIHPDDRDVARSTFERSVEEKEPFDLYYRIAGPDGTERVLHSLASIVKDADGTAVRVLGTTQDVTELKRADDKLKATSEQLRALSARLHLAREEEGIRIAREIHDELGATLTSLRWELEGIKKTLVEPGKALAAAELKDKLAAMLSLTDTMINIVRKIASDLRPVVLDVLGLEEAIEWQAQQFQERTGITVHCQSAGIGIDLDSEQSTAIFRIFQEALTNVLRHARATRVDVTMTRDLGSFVLLIRDNGRGITEDERVGELSIGLLGMRERAHLIGGEIDVSGFKGEGTAVTVRLPRSGELPTA
jgi:PAS domain S-box-containing protein